MATDTANTCMDDNPVNTALRTVAADSKQLAKPLTQRLSSALSLLLATFFVNLPTPADSETAWALGKPLVPYSASYVVGNDVVQAGNAKVDLEQRGDSEWNYSLTTEPMGLFKLAGKGYVLETSTFAVIDQNNQSVIQPKSYKFRQDNEKKRAIDATFNWDQMQLYSSRGAENSQAALSAATLDRMTMTITMMSTLNPNFESFTLNVFDGGRIKEVQLVNEGTETLSTKLGELSTVRVKTRNLASSRRETLTWFAPALNNLPVQIEQLKDGKLVARLSVAEYKQR